MILIEGLHIQYFTMLVFHTFLLITLWHKNIDSKHQGVTDILTGDDDIHTKGYIYKC